MRADVGKKFLFDDEHSNKMAVRKRGRRQVQNKRRFAVDVVCCGDYDGT